MAYAITQTCCNDASCVSVCPVNCIHPTPGEPEFGRTEMLYIDPVACIDCGACADACPVDAVFPVDRLAGPDLAFGELNSRYYQDNPTDHAWGAPDFPRSLPNELDTLRVAIVGTGPSASYTAQTLLRSTGAEVTMIDRLPVPGGLIRHGVAPDHEPTKKIADSFAGIFRHPRLRMHLNVEIGADLTHADLTDHHHAVIYAVGAATDRRLSIPGEDLSGSIAATTFVGWYNAEPTVPGDAVDLSSERVVIVGNGNVAVDIARILLSGPDRLAATDIADHALAALRTSRVQEVVLLARRGPEQAAWTRPEFLALGDLPGVELVVDDHPEVRKTIAAAAPGSKAAPLAELPVKKVDLTRPPRPGKRIVLRFLSGPTAVLSDGDGRVQALRVTGTRLNGSEVAETGEGQTILTGTVVRSIGHRGVPVPGLPFDDATGAIPQCDGRVIDPSTGLPLPGTYVVGWAKRGPSGGIGANRACAAQTVDALFEDATTGALLSPTGDGRAFARLVRRRRPDAVGLKQARTVDRAERARGVAGGRPRVKFATVTELLAAGRRFGRKP